MYISYHTNISNVASLIELPKSRGDANLTMAECKSYRFLKEDGENSAVIEVSVYVRATWRDHAPYYPGCKGIVLYPMDFVVN